MQALPEKTWSRSVYGWVKPIYSVGSLALNFTPSGAIRLVANYTLVPTAGFVGEQTGLYDKAKGEKAAGWVLEGISLVSDPIGYGFGKAAQYGGDWVAKQAIEKIGIENAEIRDLIQIGTSEVASQAASLAAAPVNAAAKKATQGLREKAEIKYFGKTTREYNPGEKVIEFADGKDQVVKEKIYANGDRKIVLASGAKVRIKDSQANQFYDNAGTEHRQTYLAKNDGVLLKTPSGVELRFKESDYEDNPYYGFVHIDKDMKSVRHGTFYSDEVNTDFSKWQVLKLKSGEEVLKDPSGRLHPTIGFKEQTGSGQLKGYNTLTAADGTKVDAQSAGWAQLTDNAKTSKPYNSFKFFKPKQPETEALFLENVASLGRILVDWYCRYRKRRLAMQELLEKIKDEERRQQFKAMQEQHQNAEAERSQANKQLKEQVEYKQFINLQEDINFCLESIEHELLQQIVELIRSLPIQCTDADIVQHFNVHLNAIKQLIVVEEKNSPLLQLIQTLVKDYPEPVQEKLQQILENQIKRAESVQRPNSEQENKFFNAVQKQNYAAQQNLPNFDIQRVAGDGSCFYYAVALHVPDTAAGLRTRVADNLHRYSEYFELENNQTNHEYIIAARNPGTYAKHVEIRVMMEIIARPIVVVRPGGSFQLVHDEQHYQNGEPIFVLYNGVDHYDGLHLKPGLSGRTILDQILSNQLGPVHVEQPIEIKQQQLSRNIELKAHLKESLHALRRNTAERQSVQNESSTLSA